MGAFHLRRACRGNYDAGQAWLARPSPWQGKAVNVGEVQSVPVCPYQAVHGAISLDGRRDGMAPEAIAESEAVETR